MCVKLLVAGVMKVKGKDSRAVFPVEQAHLRLYYEEF